MRYVKVVAIVLMVLFSVCGNFIAVEASAENKNESRALLGEMFSNPDNYVYVYSSGSTTSEFLKLDSVKVQLDNNQETVISVSYVTLSTFGIEYSCNIYETKYAFKNELKEVYEAYNKKDGTSYWERKQLVNFDGSINGDDGRRIRNSRQASYAVGIEDVYYYATGRYFRPENPFNISSEKKRSTFKALQAIYKSWYLL